MGEVKFAAQPERAALVVRGQRLEYLTLAWNSLEAAVALASGLAAGSVALLGFGFDSVIETFSGATLLWRLRRDYDSLRREHAERTALRLVGISLVLLALYVAGGALRTVIARQQPERSIPGLAIAAGALIVMPLLARAKRRVAAALASGALQADSRQTDIRAYLSAILLAGLLLNALWGWWWADPAAALLMSPLIAREGVNSLRGRSCACHGD
jgi:divalent metal cation (Fe/Co/Zn/Cd) transporter